MFTGIIETIGYVNGIKYHAKDITLSIDADKLDLTDVKQGDSIAHNGVCLTVTKLNDNGYDADLSLETLKCSGFSSIKVGFAINLEKAMQVNARFGGHIVSGHVDGLGEITSITVLGNSIEYWVKAPDNLSKYIAQKGSVTVDGISLTTNEIDGSSFKLTIIPYTLKQTIMSHYQVGTLVNLEVDVIARYIERLMLGDNLATTKNNNTPIMDLLGSSGIMSK
ncbi:MAG: riboflavin synthase [Psychromonas sp.]|nr:riboflavin synthase [Psychromonas sp.]